MTDFQIPVLFSSWGLLSVKADSLAKALVQADKSGLPVNPEYVSHSESLDVQSILDHNPGLTKKDLDQALQELLDIDFTNYDYANQFIKEYDG